MKKDPVIIAIVQARLGSTRLPGKVLLDVNGKPMLWHVMRRAMASKRVTKTILATADNVENKPVVDFAAKHGFEVYAGSEIDLVDRFYQPCKKAGADIVVRITADCPLIDPQLIDRTIEYYIANADKIDYVSCNRPHKLPHGLDIEVFPMSTLETLWREAEGEFGREWFITNILDNPARWRIGDIGFEQDITDYRWTVDYPEDMELVREIFRELDSDERVFGLYDMLALYKKRPELAAINENRLNNTVQMGIDEAKKKAAGK